MLRRENNFRKLYNELNSGYIIIYIYIYIIFKYVYLVQFFYSSY